MIADTVLATAMSTGEISVRKAWRYLYERYSVLGFYQKLGVWGAIASIFALLVTIFTLVPGANILTDAILVQKGRMTHVRDGGVFEVFYPQPYQTTPELTWLNQPLAFQVIEQRSDGFVIRITIWSSGDPPPAWQAKGMPKRGK